MTNIFYPVFIKENEILFYSLIIVIVLMILLTITFVIKELKK